VPESIEQPAIESSQRGIVEDDGAPRRPSTTWEGVYHMKWVTILLVGCVSITLLGSFAHSWDGTSPLIIDHNCTDLSQIPQEWIDSVQAGLRAYYVHTSHGQQLTCGLERLEGSDPRYDVSIGYNYLPTDGGAFCLFDRQGDPDDYWYGPGITMTRSTHDANPTINISMFSWCFQLGVEDAAYVEAYFDSMETLEAEYPGVTFIYMTNNAQKNSSIGYNRYQRNEQVREYCINNNKVLFDFADLDSWWYNGATEEWEFKSYDYEGHTVPWQHFEWAGENCGHVNWASCEQKGKAVWWMLAKLAGWDADTLEYSFLRGDADGDMTILMSDAVYILEYLYVPGASPPPCGDGADVDDSGSVLMSDAMYLLSHLYVPGAPDPPSPFPSCGDDPTADGLGCNLHPCGVPR
jgi:hypothetical protein